MVILFYMNVKMLDGGGRIIANFYKTLATNSCFILLIEILKIFVALSVQSWRVWISVNARFAHEHIFVCSCVCVCLKGAVALKYWTEKAKIEIFIDSSMIQLVVIWLNCTPAHRKVMVCYVSFFRNHVSHIQLYYGRLYGL